MKKFALAAVAMVMGASAAFAADMPVRPKPSYVPYQAYAPATNWTGFYVGGSVGYNLSEYSDGFVNNYYGNNLSSMKSSGFAYGGQVGGLFEATNHYVIGTELDLYGGGGKGSRSYDACPGCFGIIKSTGYDSFRKDYWGSARLIVGYDRNNVLFYGTGGLAFASGSFDNTTITKLCGCGTTVTTSSNTKGYALGYTVGGGVDYKFANNWSARMQYLYADYSVGSSQSGAVRSFANANDHTVTFGVNYHLN